jgi:hypothetical protein
VGVVVAVERPDVAPVAPAGLGGARDLVVAEVVDVGLPALDEHRDDVAAHVVPAVGVLGVAGDRVDQRLRREDVVPHGRVDLVRRVGEALGVGGLLAERRDATAVGADLDDAELVGHGQRLADAGHRHCRTGGHVLRHHLRRVHPVDVVGAEDDDVAGPFVVDEVAALVDGVGRAGEPAGAEPLLRRHRRHVVVEQGRQAPGLGDVAVERVALVLGQHDELAVAAVDQVRQHEVDHAVHAPEGDGGLGTVGCQGHEPLALAAGEDDPEHGGGHARTVTPAVIGVTTRPPAPPPPPPGGPARRRSRS